MLTLKKRVLIIGGGPGGRFSYIALRRMGEKSLSIVMNEDPTVICSLPYSVGRKLIPGGPEEEVVDLANSDRLPPEIVEDAIRGVITELDAENHIARGMSTEGPFEIYFEKVLLAPGAVPWIPPVKGLLSDKEGYKQDLTEVMVGREYVSKEKLAENIFVMRGADDARALDAFAEKSGRAVVVGSGAIGLEVVEALHDRGLTVTLVEALPHLIAAMDQDMAEKVNDRLSEWGVSVYKNIQLTEVKPDRVILSDGREIETDGVVFATGVRPNVTLAQSAGLSVERGIVVNEKMQSSHPDIYVVGDAAQIRDAVTGRPILPLIGTLAMRQGLVASFNIMGQTMSLPPATVWGLSAIFDLHWGSVGWTEELANASDIQAFSLTLPYYTREKAMPNGKEGLWKIIVSATDEKGLKKGQIIGFQVVIDGESPLFLTERFIDIITRRETVFELFSHYFVHSPYHNTVEDPYLMLLFAAQEAMTH
ncbi:MULTISPECIES: NAD(P)/FAD-dependent oxidoreductase [Aminobacterium]|nr:MULTISPECIES: NAD(P)/FAD-dependent oxidoreductase [Aminobacterium]